MEKLRLHLRSFSQPPDHRHLDVLDGIRVLFVLLIGWYHIWQQGWLTPNIRMGNLTVNLDFLLRSGYIWVDGLMLLSGFLLYLPYTGKGTPPSLLTFYKRRLIRILPSYLLCIIPLFILALCQGTYRNASDAIRDLLAHLSFTHTLFPFSYQQTPLNGALWTLGVEMQFYLLFPLIAFCYKKKPVLTGGVMFGIALFYRHLVAGLADNSLYINQLPAFLDVYALGFFSASLFAEMQKRMGKEGADNKIKLFFTAVFFLCICLIIPLLKTQAGQNGYENIRLGQLQSRLPLCALLSCAMISAAFSLPPVRFLLGNRLMGFLSAISLQFYIWHQWLAVQIKNWDFIPHENPMPWMAGEYSWQLKYTLTCFLAAIVAASLITYLFEKPITRKLRK